MPGVSWVVHRFVLYFLLRCLLLSLCSIFPVRHYLLWTVLSEGSIRMIVPKSPQYTPTLSYHLAYIIPTNSPLEIKWNVKGKEEMWLKHPAKDSHLIVPRTPITHWQVSWKVYQPIIFPRRATYCIISQMIKFTLLPLLFIITLLITSEERYHRQIKTIL